MAPEPYASVLPPLQLSLQCAAPLHLSPAPSQLHSQSVPGGGRSSRTSATVQQGATMMAGRQEAGVSRRHHSPRSWVRRSYRSRSMSSRCRANSISDATFSSYVSLLLPSPLTPRPRSLPPPPLPPPPPPPPPPPGLCAIWCCFWYQSQLRC